MVVTVEVRSGEGTAPGTMVGFVRILGPHKNIGRAEYAVGAIENAPCGAGASSKAAGCAVVGHDPRQGVWALLERACAALKNADFVGP